MSLKTLFNRESPVVRSLEVAGVVLAGLQLWKHLLPFDWRGGLFLFLVACCLFIFACDLIRWYPGSERTDGPRQKIGIEVHFLKARVPTSYILAIASALALLQIPYVSTGVVLLADLMMLVVAPVNGILIWFHRFDKDTTPMNYFSLNKYLGSRHEDLPSYHR
ncbi:MAG TPA: hypothetical protein VLJ37_12090 [bacterium]|nr:hypothetical protein [bacterium]